MEKFIFGGKIEICGNEHYRIFHMRHQLVEKHGWFSTEYHYDDKMGRYGEKNMLPCSMITINALQNNIPGIKSVSFRPYEIAIEKASAFSWEELIPKIKLELSRYLPAKY